MYDQNDFVSQSSRVLKIKEKLTTYIRVPSRTSKLLGTIFKSLRLKCNDHRFLLQRS